MFGSSHLPPVTVPCKLSVDLSLPPHPPPLRRRTCCLASHSTQPATRRCSAPAPWKVWGWSGACRCVLAEDAVWGPAGAATAALSGCLLSCRAPPTVNADDVAALPAGSETELGERGINLSGAPLGLPCAPALPAVAGCSVHLSRLLRAGGGQPLCSCCCVAPSPFKRMVAKTRALPLPPQAARRRGWRWRAPPTRRPTSRWGRRWMVLCCHSSCCRWALQHHSSRRCCRPPPSATAGLLCHLTLRAAAAAAAVPVSDRASPPCPSPAAAGRPAVCGGPARRPHPV